MAGGEGKWERKMSKVNETTCAYTSVSRESAATYVDGTKPFSAFRVEIEISFPLQKSAFILQMLCVIAICLFSPTWTQPQPFSCFCASCTFLQFVHADAHWGCSAQRSLPYVQSRCMAHTNWISDWEGMYQAMFSSRITTLL